MCSSGGNPESKRTKAMCGYLDSPDGEWFNRRLKGTMILIFIAFSVILVRLFYLQVVQGHVYRELSTNNRIRLQSLPSSRGLIYDSEGKLLVDNRPAFDLLIVPRDAKPLSETLERLSRFTGVPVAEMMERIAKKGGEGSSRQIVLKRGIGRDVLAPVEVHSFDLPGVVVKVRPKRFYLNPGMAAHLLGYLGEINARELSSGKHPEASGGDFIGKFGVEKVMEPLLRGSQGGRQVEVDAHGRVIRELKRVEADPGKNIYLTVNTKLQKKAEALLKGDVGSVVALDPRTGAVLAMASSPTFDQNDFVSGLSYAKWNSLKNNPGRPMENKATQALYPPASIYKIVSSMAALEEKVVDARTRFYCSGRHAYGDRTYRCWKRTGHGSVDVVDSIAQSCDVFYYEVGERIGVDRLAFYARGCGLGRPTGVELAGEAAGLIPTAEWKRRKLGQSWLSGETLSLTIGQSYNLVTPIQMAMLIASVGNGGTIYKPHILGKIETADGSLVKETRPVVKGHLPVGKKNLGLIQKGLWGAVNDHKGTARRARINGVTLAGKTGTAQVISKGESGVKKKKRIRKFRDHAWFVAYAPMENPTIAVAVIVEHGEGGSTKAAPIARKVIETYLGKGEDVRD
ncbi:penicillin-binding protein 2 [Desulfoluna sp.]|uniref:penicillin-binding protein 2 n=1 Tax=Desulfoluna sp. TaxID=2045199 RepID=UPI0026057A46|nr:penicillin-binding protein 2 [Desulfoluna sp.]